MSGKYVTPEVGSTFTLAGWTWTVTEVVRGGRSYFASTPLPDGREMVRKFSAWVGDVYYGEPDPEEDES